MSAHTPQPSMVLDHCTLSHAHPIFAHMRRDGEYLRTGFVSFSLSETINVRKIQGQAEFEFKEIRYAT